jgi:hypothetical protein
MVCGASFGWTAGRKRNGLTIPVYRHLIQLKFSSRPIPVPAGGIVFKRDNASWNLEKGHIRLMQPTADGKVTGLIFEGEGRFRMTVPHGVEKDHLRRCSGKKNIENIDQSFSKLLLRTPEPLIPGLVAVPGNAAYVENELAKDRRRVWRERAKTDVDARVAAGLFNPADEFLWIEMKTRSFGWITYIFDKYMPEEIRLQKFRRKYEFVETWVSLDRDSDRTASGAPGSGPRPRIDINAMDIEANLTSVRLRAPSFRGMQTTEQATFNTTVTFTARENGLRMVRFNLSPLARIKSIRSAAGKPLPFLRKELGKTILVKKNKQFTSTFWILLDKPRTIDEKQKITVLYQLDIHNFVSGGTWYPQLSDNINDRHTVRLTARLPAGIDIRAVGKKVDESIQGRIKISRWQSEAPAKIYGFTVGKRYRVEQLSHEGLPRVVSFGTEGGITSGNMIRNVGVDVLNSLKFYEHYFGIDFPYETVRATAIDSGHGQAFQGFLHLSRYTYASESPGASELFRAHEVAHLMWGHMVGWKSYRDQWLSEAFSEYSAMLYIQAVMPGKKHFNHILDAYTHEQNGSIKTVFSKYVRPWRMMGIKWKRQKMGPIGIGFRAATADAPMGYQIQAYHKGALVLHMMRMIMRNASGGDDLFRRVLKDFLHTYAGRDASTADFKRVIEKHTHRDWSWFFKQWVNGTAIPTYSWSTGISKKDPATGKYKLKITIKQSGVPDGFKMHLPLRVRFKDGSVRQFLLPVNKPEQTFNMDFPKKIKKLILNPDHSVLAKMKKH